MSKRQFGSTLFTHNDVRYSIFKAYLQDMMVTDGTSNPVLWFVKEVDTQDMPVCGLPTKQQALDALNIPAEHIVR